MTAPARHVRIAQFPVTFTPDGRPCCRWCRTPILTGRTSRRWCGQKCIDEYLIRASAAGARSAVLERDNGVCAGCRVDTARVARIGEMLWTRAKGYATHRWPDGYQHPELHRARWERFGAWVRTHVAASYHSVTDHLWEADHIVPVAEGGGSTGLDNLRTLCKRCHARETGALRKRLNEAKAPQLRLPGGGT